MSVTGIITRAGAVDWTWRDGKMRVTVRGRRIPVRLGQSSPSDAQGKAEFK